MDTKWLKLSLGILLFGGGLVLGRFSTKPQIQEKIVTKEVIKTVEVEKVQDNKQDSKKEAKDEHKVVVVVRKKDGTITTKTVVDTHDRQVEVKTEIKYVDRVVSVDKEVEKRVEIKITPKEVNWQFSANFGIRFDNLALVPNPPYFKPALIGLEVDRRVIGPVWVGAWGLTDLQMSTKAAGLSLKLQW